MPDNSVIAHDFEVNDTLWIVYTHIATQVCMFVRSVNNRCNSRSSLFALSLLLRAPSTGKASPSRF
jgi:hypothetical protein